MQLLSAAVFTAVLMLTAVSAGSAAKPKAVDFIHVKHSDLYRTDDDARTTLYEGDVVIEVRDIKLNADSVLIDEEENSLTARGKVELRRTEYDTDSEFLYINFDEERVHWKGGVQIVLKPKSYRDNPAELSRRERLKRALLKNETRLHCDEAVYWFGRKDFWGVSDEEGGLLVEQTGKKLNCTELTYNAAESYLRCSGAVETWQRDGKWLYEEGVFGEDEKPLFKRMMQDSLTVRGDMLEFHETESELLVTGRAELDEAAGVDHRAIAIQPGREVRGARIYFSDSENIFRCRGLAYMHQDDGKWIEEGGAIPESASQENRELMSGEVTLKGDEFLSYTDTNDFFVYGSGYFLATSSEGPGEIVNNPMVEEEEPSSGTPFDNEPYPLLEDEMAESEMKRLLEEDTGQSEDADEDETEEGQDEQPEFPLHGRAEPIPLGERQKELIFDEAEFINAEDKLTLMGEVLARNFRFQGSIIERVTGEEIVLNTRRNDITKVDGGFQGTLLIDDGRDLGRIGEQGEEGRPDGGQPSEDQPELDRSRFEPGAPGGVPFEDDERRQPMPLRR